MKKKKAIEGIKTNKSTSNYMLVDRAFLRDEYLSFKAKGILAFLFFKPELVSISADEIVSYTTDDIDSVNEGINELEKAGYVKCSGCVGNTDVKNSQEVQW